MNKLIAATALAAALALVAPQSMAEDTKKMETTGDKATGAAADPTHPPPGTETSDRTPEKKAMTPDTQVDKTKEGATSDRTPEKK